MSETIVFVRMPESEAGQFPTHWRTLRVAEGLDPSADLDEPVVTENFDGASLVEWAVPVVKSVVPLLTAVFGYLVAARGEIEIERDGERIKIKNMKPSAVRELLAAIDEDAARRDARQDGE